MDTPMNVPLPPYARMRQSKRAVEDRAEAYAVLDTGLVGHVGFIAEGRPMVIPMAYARIGDTLYLHGASKTRIMRMTGGAPLCLTVTRIDGLVVARSGFHHSVNYACVVVHGTGRAVTGAEADAALDAVVDHLLPGRSGEVRGMTAQERKATGVIALDIDAITMKRRDGPPVDDAEDIAAGGWAGVLPVATVLGTGLADAHSGAAPEPPSLARARAKFATAQESSRTGLELMAL
jgi:nitroimidazol reductase NimA-like FMN-containing flavoprotein (pyridoxamine 5'-phosphate oxidase superfamily)